MIGAKPIVAIKALTTGSTEYEYTVVAGTKKILFKLRNGSYDILFAYLTGEIAAGRYVTLPAGATKSIEEIKGDGLKIYFQCATAAQTVEIEYWK